MPEICFLIPKKSTRIILYAMLTRKRERVREREKERERQREKERERKNVYISILLDVYSRLVRHCPQFNSN